MAAGRPDLFPPDRGLQARMAIALTVGALLSILYAVAIIGGAIALLVLVGGEDGLWAAGTVVGIPALMLLIGWAHARGASIKPATGSRKPTPEDAERVRAATERLCLIADLDPPATKVVEDRIPLSWTTATPFREPRVQVTTGLLDALPDPELQAVLAHELSHLANRDARVMTLVGSPSVYLLSSQRVMIEDDAFKGTMMLLLTVYFLVPALVIAAFARTVSRQRELVADRSSGLITGSPAALASALVRIRGDMIGGEIFLVDLRHVAPRNQFHILPAELHESGGGSLWASHPSLQDRLDQLHEMERTLQWTRGPGALILEETPPPPPQQRSAPASGGSSRASSAG